MSAKFFSKNISKKQRDDLLALDGVRGLLNQAYRAFNQFKITSVRVNPQAVKLARARARAARPQLSLRI